MATTWISFLLRWLLKMYKNSVKLVSYFNTLYGAFQTP